MNLGFQKVTNVRKRYNSHIENIASQEKACNLNVDSNVSIPHVYLSLCEFPLLKN